MEKVEIMLETASSYVVNSPINDVALKALLAKEYHLKPSQISQIHECL